MSGPASNGDASLILVVDDDPAMRLMLRKVMAKEGYRVCEATNGEEGLQIFEQQHPDLILMDGMMPELNGFEACARLQDLPGGTDTPVLMITGLDDNASVDEAFAVGAVDYVTKPIHWAVLRQRVRRILALKQVEELRDDLTHMIVHDMKNPISAIFGFSELLLLGMEGQLVEGQTQALERIHRSSSALLEMAMMILDMKRLKEGKLPLNYTSVAVCQTLNQVADSLAWMAKNHGITIIIDCPDTGLSACLDWSLIQRVLANLVSNALKHSSRGSQVVLSGSVNTAGVNQQCLAISVRDQGEGIARQDQSAIFEKFNQAAGRHRGSRTDTGLGLTFCKLAVEAHAGRIELDSQVGVGSIFTMLLPFKP